jgi:multiple sugar transport system ATP-binding protein
MAKVVLEHVSKRYGGGLAVDRVHLQVEDRELLVLLGPSGCGKTTTLRLIAGLEAPDEGQILIHERSMRGVPPQDRNVAMVFQNYAMYPHMTVYDNLAFGLKMRNVTRAEIERRVSQASEILGIAELWKRKPDQLSGGQQQRVAVGRAMVRNPAVFLLDEPLSNLDAQLRNTMRGELARLQEQLQTTMIYVTHDQQEAMLMGHRIVVMDAGRIMQVGTPHEIYSRPANRFVAEFVGNPPMNLVPAWVQAEPEGFKLHVETAEIKLSGPRWERVASKSGCGILVGVRPQDIDLQASSGQADDAWQFTAQVDAVRDLGSELIVEFVWASENLRWSARAPSRPAMQRGDSVPVRVDLEKIHLFDKETGARI